MKVVRADGKGIKLAVRYLKAGKAVVYPTDTSYGLAVDANNAGAVRRLYKIKQRKFGTPVHIIVPSVSFAKKIVSWNKIADQLARKFWPGPLTLVLGLRHKPQKSLEILSAGTGTMGLRFPNNKIALRLARDLKKPITTASANPPNHLGGYDSYSPRDVTSQFAKKKYRPDLILDAGRLPKRKPSTFVKIQGNKIEILRQGPISKKQIQKATKC